MGDLYLQMANAKGRQIEAKVEIGAETFTTEINELEIQHELASDTSDIVIGRTPSARLSLKLNTTGAKVASKAAVRPYVRFVTADGSTVTEWQPLGLYYVNYRYANKGVLSITAYDRMYFLDTPYTTKLTAPVAVADALEEFVETLGLEVDFTPRDFFFAQPPTGYTNREVLGFIASMHGGNGLFNQRGAFTVSAPGESAEISLENCIAQTLDDNPFTIRRIVCVVDEYKSFNSEDEATEFHTLAFSNPYMQQDAFDYVCGLYLGKSYVNLKLEKQGTGLLLLGQELAVPDYNNQSATVDGFIGYLAYTLKDGAFRESIESRIRSESDSEYIKPSDLTTIVNDSVKTLQEAVYHYQNTTQLTISELPATIIKLNFTTNADCTPLFHAEVNCIIDIPGTLLFTYLVDGSEYHIAPKQTVTEGYYIIHLFCPLEFDRNTAHEFQVRLQTDGAAGRIDKQQCQAVVSGQGLSVVTYNWDGTIAIEEAFTPINVTLLPDTNVKVSKLYENISLATDDPTPAGVAETFAPITVTLLPDIKISVTKLNEAVTAGFVVEKNSIDFTALVAQNPYTCTADGYARLKTAWEFAPRAETVDSGTLWAFEPDCLDAAIQSLEVVFD